MIVLGGTMLRQRNRAEWQALFAEAGIPCGAMNTVGEALDHPQLKHRGFIAELESDHGPVKLFNFPAKFSGQYYSPRNLPPLVGADTDRVLADIGYGEQEIALLRQDGVI